MKIITKRNNKINLLKETLNKQIIFKLMINIEYKL